MKKYLAALSAFAVAGIAPLALAVSSTDLTVTGTITPNACSPSLSGSGNVDYGKISAKDLNPTTSTSLEPRTVNLSVNCDAATRFALQGIDNRAGSSDLDTAFGLGKINDSQNIGRYLLGMSSAVADGLSVQAIKSEDGQTGWVGHLFWTPGYYVSVADKADVSQPILVKDLDMELVIGASISPANNLDLSNEVSIDGAATLEMKYL